MNWVDFISKKYVVSVLVVKLGNFNYILIEFKEIFTKDVISFTLGLKPEVLVGGRSSERKTPSIFADLCCISLKWIDFILKDIHLCGVFVGQ